MRGVLFALGLAVVGLSAQSCGGKSSAPTSAQQSERPLSAFQPYLTRTLTPSAARAQFGAPNEVTGSGLIIYKYRVEGGQMLWLGFPGQAAISYAKLQSRDGQFTEIALQ
jgi:hypothetical protein